MRKLASESIDLCVTSPPYDNLRAYIGFSFDFESVARELTRILKPGGVIVWVVGDAVINGSETGTSFRQALFFKDVCGLNLHDTMLYAKPNPIPRDSRQRRYTQAFEYMFVLAKGKPKAFNGLRERSKNPGRRTGNAIRLPNGKMRRFGRGIFTAPTKLRANIFPYINNSSPGGHPATFPEQLAADQINSWSNPGDVVLDCFLGSGTTGKMAVLNGRKFIGCELSSEYLKIARRRIQSAR